MRQSRGQADPSMGVSLGSALKPAPSCSHLSRPYMSPSLPTCPTPRPCHRVFAPSLCMSMPSLHYQTLIQMLNPNAGAPSSRKPSGLLLAPSCSALTPQGRCLYLNLLRLHRKLPAGWTQRGSLLVEGSLRAELCPCCANSCPQGAPGGYCSGSHQAGR